MAIDMLQDSEIKEDKHHFFLPIIKHLRDRSVRILQAEKAIKNENLSVLRC